MSRFFVALGKGFDPEQPRADAGHWQGGGDEKSSAWAAGRAAFHRQAAQNARDRAVRHQANGDHKRMLRALKAAAYHAKKADHHDELVRLRRENEATLA